jgi:hypothetical protein
MDWQTAAVIVIELLALSFLVYRLVGGRRARRSSARASMRPDVGVGSLLRRPRR